MRYLLGTTLYTSLIFKRAPGTMSSLAVFLVFFFLNPIAVEVKCIIAAGVLLCHAFCFEYFVKRFETEDPPLYTIDEALTMVILSIPFTTQLEWLSAFLIFRCFDIVKPFGIRRVEKLPGIPLSIRNVADDVLAGFYTIIIILVFENVF